MFQGFNNSGGRPGGSKSTPSQSRLSVRMLLTLILIAAIGAVCLTGAAQAGTVSLPQTGQTTTYAAGDDGAIRAGVAWPNPRFTDNSIADSNNQTITDNLTGLMWAKDAGTPTVGSCTGGAMNWQAALNYVACLNTASYLGYTDWRLPNINELESLLNAEYYYTWLNSQGFTNVQEAKYWSSTSVVDNTLWAWFVAYRGGISMSIKTDSYDTSYYYAWPVRGGQSGAFGNAFVWATGQTTSYDANTPQRDDGAIRAGMTWPNPRFTDNSIADIGNQTVTDNLTGLIWTKDASSPTVGSCTGAMVQTWQQALSYVACLNTSNYLDHSDWRLPNRKELKSLIDYGSIYTSSDYTFSVEPTFTGVMGTFYCSSNTYLDDISVDFYNVVPGVVMVGNVGSLSKTSVDCFVWPVRGGQFNLSTSKTGSGTVTSSPVGITCGSTCSYPYQYGTVVELTALADSGFLLYGWTGCDSISDGKCSVTVSANKSVSVTFATPTPSPTVTPTPIPTATPTPAPTPVVVTDDKGQPVTISVATTATISSISATTTPDTNGLNLSIGNSGKLPLGTITFTLTNVQPNVDTQITFYLPQTVTVNRVFKYGPTPTNATSSWYNFTCNSSLSNKPCGEINVLQGQKVVILHLTDGAIGDNDLTVNGTIVDPVAFVQDVATVPTLNEYGVIVLMGLLCLVMVKRLRGGQRQ
ncbi:secreted protein containing DUF1566 [Candidatus Magnetobacterium bavaricum]|uniref:Secreted protein containing DUF1566 n=1 Tax=Candidatus Magnetobacterium bavaricum TaxID=29290 RepID=A0A0F3GW64_9BACT|nr:secreted protein containing DUF1566 [Candidatus Magnetobacterium bavaricum]